MTVWPLDDWYEPDLDRGIIIHKTLTNAEVSALPKRTARYVVHAADAFAAQADAEGIAVTAEEWLLGGKEHAQW